MKLIPFDTETTGVDTQNDRLVTAFLGLMNEEGEFEQQVHYLVDPGVEIPKGASDVHGISTETARERGQKDVGAVIGEILSILHSECIVNGHPLVAYNAPFDLSLLVAEARRHIDPNIDLSFLREIKVLDPLVLDKGFDKYRKGSRKLVDAAKHYGVPVEANAHDAAADCLMAGRIALKILGSLATRSTLDELHRKQHHWKKEQAASLQTYFRTKAPAATRNPDAIVDGGWPFQSVVKWAA